MAKLRLRRPALLPPPRDKAAEYRRAYGGKTLEPPEEGEGDVTEDPDLYDDGRYRNYTLWTNYITSHGGTVRTEVATHNFTDHRGEVYRQETIHFVVVNFRGIEHRLTVAEANEEAARYYRQSLTSMQPTFRWPP